MRSICTFFSLLLPMLWLSACQPVGSLPSNAQEHAVDGAYAGALSQDGRYSLVSSVHHGMALWDTEKNALVYQWQQADDNLVLAQALAEDNSVALTADEQNFALWDVNTGENKGYWSIKDSSIRDVAVSNQGRYLLIGQSDGKVLHIDLQTARRLEFLGHTERINSVAMSANGHFALTGGNDYAAYFWDTRTAQVLHKFNHPSRVTKVALDSQGRYAFTADSQKQATIWDLTTGKAVSQLQYTARQMVFSAVRFNQAGTLLATGAPTREVRLWQVNDGKNIGQWQVMARKDTRPESAVVYDVSFMANDSKLRTLSSSGVSEVWSLTP